MNLRTLLVFAAFVPAIWGQAPAEVRIPESDAPAAVNQALRERVTSFYQNHTGSVNRRAIDYVAEDTKDFYFSARKTVYKRFALKKIEYISKDFDRADVTVETTYDMPIEGNLLENTQPAITTWKIDEGKWSWTRDVADPRLSPMSIFSAAAGAAAIKPQGGDPGAKPPIDLKNLDMNAMIAQQQRAIMDQSKLDRSSVEFVAGKAGEQQVTLQNGFTGDIGLQLEGSGVDGVTVTLDKTTVHPHENAVVRFKYTPADAKAQSGTVRLVVMPFGQTFPIQIQAK
jgi:hypothetical protein